MNVRNFQGSTLTSFIITTLALLTGSLLLWWSFTPLQKLYHISKYRKPVIRAIGKVWWRLPLCGLVLVAFTLRFGFEKTRGLMVALSLFTILRNEPRVDEFPYHESPYLDCSEIERGWWLNRVDHVRNVTHKSDWVQRTLRHRIKNSFQRLSTRLPTDDAAL